MQLELLKARAAGGVADTAAALPLIVNAPSAKIAVGGVHSYSCSGCGRFVRLECAGHSGGSARGGDDVTGTYATEFADNTARLAASEETVRRLQAENAQLSSQYAQVAAELCDADARRPHLDLLGTLVSACKNAMARWDATGSESSRGNTGADIVADIRMALEMVEVASQTGEEVSSNVPSAELDVDLFADLYLDDLVPGADVAMTAADASKSAGILVADSDAAGPAQLDNCTEQASSSPSSLALDAAAATARSTFVVEFNTVSSRIRDTEAALASERLARAQLERRLRIITTELDRVQGEKDSVQETILTASSTPVSPDTLSSTTGVTTTVSPVTSVDVVALHAQLAEREGRIRTLSAQVGDIQRRLGDNVRQNRIQSLEQQAAVLRETRSELQVRLIQRSRRAYVFSREV